MSDPLMEVIRGQLAIIGDAVLKAQAALPPPAPSGTLVRAGDNIQGLMKAGARLEVEAGARFPGTLSLANNSSVVFGDGAGMHGEQFGPAIYVPPGTTDWTVIGGTHVSPSTESVIQIGENTPLQNTLAAQPSRGAMGKITVPTHRGKRAFAVHGRQILLSGVTVRDVWSSQDYDSQAIYIGNAQGEISVRSSFLEAGGEIILSGGDSVRTPGLHPTGLEFIENTISRPLSWMTDADSTKRRVKNLFELKDGIDVVFRDNICRGNWNDARVSQGAYAVVLTPALDGAIKNPPLHSGVVGNVLIQGNTFLDVGAGINCLGLHYTAITVPPLYGVVVKNNRFRINSKQLGGFGQFLKIGNEPGDITVDGNIILQDGGSHVYIYKGTVLDPVTVTSRTGGKVGALTYLNNVAELGAWGFNIDGNANASQFFIDANITTSRFAGNSFKGVARKNIPAAYMADAAFEAIPEVQQLRAEA